MTNPPRFIFHARFAGLLFIFAAVVLFFTQALSARAASTDGGTEEVRVALIAQYDAVHPGEQVLIGLHQTIKPHWHTYWRNPGDSGIATSIQWTLPAGMTAGPIQWPTPNRVMIGDIVNYGYEDMVTLLTSFTIPANASPGSNLPVSAKVNWLVCKEVCIPQHAEISLTLTVAAATQNRAPANAAIESVKAALPVKAPWPVHIESGAGNIAIQVPSTGLNPQQIKRLHFFPYQSGVIKDSAPQLLSYDDHAIYLSLNAGDITLAKGEAIAGLIVTETKGGVRAGFEINEPISVLATKPASGAQTIAMTADVSQSTSAATGLSDSKSNASNVEHDADIGTPLALLLAFLGGIILNLMPCVFPVLSLKALSLVNYAHQSKRVTRLHGLAYTGGVLLSFALLGVVLIAVKAGGTQVGWGFQFQSPVFVMAVAYLVFGVGLNLSGVITPGSSLTGIGSSLADRGGYAGSFFTGVLATVVATPCTAPFMGGAIAYALLQAPAVLIAVLLSMGAGLALPYLLLSIWPLLQRWLPRPGKWMERMKQGLAFPMYATAIWLLWVLALQAGANAVAIVLSGMLAIAFAAWLFDTTRLSKNVIRHLASVIALGLVALAIAGGYAGLTTLASGVTSLSAVTNGTAQNAESEPYTAERLQSLRAAGKPVFINLTAAWCISCLVNERVALRDEKVKKSLRTLGITYLKGDWTNQDPAISQLLKEFGRSGVPLYIFYPSGVESHPMVLPQLLTPEIVVTAFAAK